MKGKRGVGSIVGWVLLLGFTISLATIVFMWTTKSTEDLSEKSVKFIEGGLQCDNVMINVAVDPATCEVTVTNTRYLNIEKLNVRKLDPSSPESFIYSDTVLEPKSEGKDENKYRVTIPTGYCGDVAVLPIIKIKEDFVGCENKIITVSCAAC